MNKQLKIYKKQLVNYKNNSKILKISMHNKKSNIKFNYNKLQMKIKIFLNN